MPIADEPLVLDLGQDGPKVWMEAVPPIMREHGSAMTPSVHGRRVDGISTTQLGEAIKAVAKRLREELHDTDPEEVSLGFGLSVDTSGRILIGATGTLRVQIRWGRPDAKEDT